MPLSDEGVSAGEGIDVDVFDGVASATLGDTLLTLWKTAATVPRIRHINDRVDALLAGQQGTVAACQFLLSSASPPGPRQAGEIRRGWKTLTPRARRLIVVPLGGAAWQSIVRGVLRAGLFVLGTSSLVKVAARPAEAFELLCEVAQAQTSPSRAELAAAFERLTQALADDRSDSRQPST